MTFLALNRSSHRQVFDCGGKRSATPLSKRRGAAFGRGRAKAVSRPPPSKTLARRRRSSISEYFFQLRARGAFTRVAAGFRRPVARGELEIFAEIADLLFQHRLGPAFAALLRCARVVMRTVQADPQVGPAFHAGLAAPRLAVQRPRLAAIMTMSGHLRFWIYDLRRTWVKHNLVNRKS